MEAIESILIPHFSASGYIVHTDVPKELTYTPNIIFEKGNNITAFYYRSSTEKLREAILQRIKETKRIARKILELNIVFDNKPKQSDLRLCNLYRLGVYYIENGELKQYSESKKLLGRKGKPQLPNTFIFFSSKQDLEERMLAKEHIEFERESHHIPVFAKLVEDDQRYNNTITDLTEMIYELMDDSHYVLCILSDEYRKIVDLEVRRAFEYFEPEEILMFVKNNKVTKESWGTLLAYMEMAGVPVKYTEYIDNSDFKRKFNRRLMIVIKELHSNHGIDFLG